MVYHASTYKLKIKKLQNLQLPVQLNSEILCKVNSNKNPEEYKEVIISRHLKVEKLCAII